MYKYFFSVTTAKEINNLRSSFGNEIETAIRKFNKSSQIARTYKKIVEETVNITEDKLEFELEIRENLEPRPSLKPLYLLSKYLLEVPGLCEYAVSKRFLKPLSIKSLQEETYELTETQVLKKLVDIYFEKDYAKRNTEVKEKIKQIVIEHISK